MKARFIDKYYGVKLFGIGYYKRHPLRTNTMIILLVLGLVANVSTDFYTDCQWFVLYPILFCYVILGPALEIYYRRLSPYDEMSVIEFILLKKFGNDIGQIIISFLDSNWSRKEFVSQK